MKLGIMALEEADLKRQSTSRYFTKDEARAAFTGIGNQDFRSDGSWLDTINVNDVIAKRQMEDEALGYSADLSEHLEGVELVEQVVDLVGQANGGMSMPVCEALMLAVNRLTARLGQPKLTPAFEEQSTSRAHLKNSAVVLEGLKDVGRRIWAAIVEALQRLAAWFKKTFSRRKAEGMLRDQRIKTLHVRVAEKKRTAPSSGASPAATFVSPSVSAHLSIKGRVPHGSALLQAAHQHFHVISELQAAADANDRVVLSELQKALSAIKSKNTDFQAPMGEALSSMGSSFLTKRINASLVTSHALSKNVAMFAQPLVFGDRLYWRSGVIGSGQIQLNELVAGVGSIDGVTMDASQEIPKLEMAQIEALLDSAYEHVTAMQAHNRKVEEETTHGFDQLMAMAEKYMREAVQDERLRGRVTLIGHAVSAYARLRNSVLVALNNYDDHIVDALVSYAEHSNK